MTSTRTSADHQSIVSSSSTIILRFIKTFAKFSARSTRSCRANSKTDEARSFRRDAGNPSRFDLSRSTPPFKGRKGLEKVRAAVAAGDTICRGVRRCADAAGLGRHRDDLPHLEGISRSADRHMHRLFGLLLGRDCQGHREHRSRARSEKTVRQYRGHADGARSLEKVAAHADGRPANGRTRRAGEPAHHRTARGQCSAQRRSRRAHCSRGCRCTTSEERFSKAFHGSPVPMAIQRPDGPDCLDANASFLDLVGATRETVLAGRAQWWSDPETDSALHDALAGRHLPSADLRQAFARLPATRAKCSSRQIIWHSPALPTTSLSFRTSPIACGSKMNFGRRKKWKPSAASPPASLTISTTCSPSSSATPR